MKKLLHLFVSAFLLVSYLCIPICALEEEPPETPIDPEPIVTYSNMLLRSTCASGGGPTAYEMYGTIQVPYNITQTRIFFHHLAYNDPYGSYIGAFTSGNVYYVNYYLSNGTIIDPYAYSHTNVYYQYNYNANYCTVMDGYY